MGAGASVIQKETEASSTAEQKVQLRETAKTKFDELDVDKSGFLEKAELMTVAEWVISAFVEADLTVEVIKSRLMARIDLNGDGKLDFEEFLALFSLMNARYELIKRSHDKFVELDADSSGELDGPEIDKCVEWAMQIYEHEDPEFYAFNRQTMLDRIDRNRDGKVSLPEFTTLFDDMLTRLELINSAKAKFAELDADKSGLLEAAELDTLVGEVLKTYVQKSEEERDKFKTSLISKVDKNTDGKLDFSEFKRVWEMMLIRLDMIEAARIKFRSLDKDNSGFLEKEELTPVLFDWCKDSKEKTEVDLQAACDNLLASVDVNGDGKLDLLEFVVIFEKAMENECFWGVAK
jgi:Ca2+-binding EF-hand superfamily protein